MSDYDYKIVSDYAAGSLEGKVKELLKDGYAPAGGICFVPEGTFDSGLLHQAMFRKTPAIRKPKAATPKAPASVDKKVWADFIRHRKEKGHPLKATAYVQILKDMTTWAKEGHDLNEILISSIRNGWTGIFPPKKKAENSALEYVGDNDLEAWALRVGGPAPKQQGGYDYKAYRADLEAWAKTR